MTKRINLEKLNMGGLTSIHFYDNKFDYDQLDYFNLVFTGDGLYYVIKNKLGVIFSKLPSVAYVNTVLNNISYKTYMEWFIPKPSYKILEEIINCFRYVCTKTKDELMINLYWDTKTKRYIIDILKEQTISQTLVKYEYTDKYEMDDRYIRYLQIHSHNTMAANFSSTDDADEKNKIMCLCGVVGKLDKYTNLSNLNSNFRIWNGMEFLTVNIGSVFEMPPQKEYVLDNDVKTLLDTIISNSKKIKEQESTSNIFRLPGFTRQNEDYDEFTFKDGIFNWGNFT